MKPRAAAPYALILFAALAASRSGATEGLEDERRLFEASRRAVEKN